MDGPLYCTVAVFTRIRVLFRHLLVLACVSLLDSFALYSSKNKQRDML